MKLILTGLVVVLVVHTVNAACAPGTVGNITLFSNNTLTWSEPPNPNLCTINSYLINVINNDDGTLYQFEGTKDRFYYEFKDVLDMCQTYIFEVHALTNESVLGESETYEATTPPSENINLTVVITNATSNATTQQINVAWNLSDPASAKCIAYYRVVYWTDHREPIDTYVTDQNAYLYHDVPCSNYTIEVNAVVANPIIEGPIGHVALTAAGKVPSIPSIVSLDPGSTMVDMVWKLETYAQNHCVLSALTVYTLGLTGSTARIVVPITDNIERNNVNVNITGLTSNKVYTAMVSVTNVIGTSSNVSVSFQTTS